MIFSLNDEKNAIKILVQDDRLVDQFSNLLFSHFEPLQCNTD